MWVFPKIGVPQNGWFIMKNLFATKSLVENDYRPMKKVYFAISRGPLKEQWVLKWMIWGYHRFRKPPCVILSVCDLMRFGSSEKYLSSSFSANKFVPL